MSEEYVEKTFDKVIVYLLKEWSENEVKNFVRKTNSVIEHIYEKPKTEIDESCKNSNQKERSFSIL